MSLEGSLTPASNLGGSVEITTLSIMDAARFGFDPDASASDNVTAIQAALDLGGIITVRKPGTYQLNDTIYIGSNTKFILSGGVILQKTGDYSNVLMNKGALTKTYTENVIIDGLEISVNGVDNIVDLDIPGLRGHLAFYYIKDFALLNYRCTDVASNQFTIQMAKWHDVYFKNITLAGEKDGLDLGVGYNGLFENLNFTTHDDAIALYVAGYPSAMVEVGDVHNITFRNVNDYVKDGAGYTCRIMTSSWADWADGNTYQTGDLTLNGGYIYICDNATGFSAVAGNAPVHTSGSVTGADGISWRFCNASTSYHGDVYDITFDNFSYYDVRTPIDARFLDNIYMRSVYPGTETLSSIYDIKIINSAINGPLFMIQNSANMKNLIISNCIIDGVTAVIRSNAYDADSNALWYITFTGNQIKDATFLINNQKDGQLIYMVAAGNYENVNPIYIHNAGTATVRLINQDISLPSAELSDLTPLVGDICRTDNGLWIYKAGGWVNLAI